MRVRKIPVEVDAIQFTGDNYDEVIEWQNSFGPPPVPGRPHPAQFWEVDIQDRMGGVVAEVWDKLHVTWVGVKVNDYIIRGVVGEFYPVDRDVFWTTYEKVNSPS